MNAATLQFLQQRFTSYYGTDRLVLPPDVSMREWGCILFSDDPARTHMRRHLAFGSSEEAAGYIRGMVPAHAYYSTAFYRNPGAPTMAEKGWAGADLIFDLDADHLVRGPYDLMLARVKEETEKLLSMLCVEMGFSQREIAVVFSGGRGYHVHVRSMAVRDWGSAERREMIDYVCGIGIDPSLLFRTLSHSPRGWQARYREALREYIGGLLELPPDEAVAAVSALEGVGKTTAERFLRQAGEILVLVGTPGSQIPFGDPVAGKVLRAAASREGPLTRLLQARAALADEPVTTDIHRLIRLPGSLHGGSGLRVTPLTVDDIDAFDPMTDAVVFGDREIPVTATRALTVRMGEERYSIAAGSSRLPEALAVFLCCRGLAEVGGGG